jgi:hypothetical protein
MALVFLVLVWVVNRWPMERENWYRRVPGYAVLVIVADLVHTTLMWGSRLVIFPLAGLGPYDYGIMHYRYPMEFAINGPNVAFLIGVLHAWRYYQSARRRELESAQLAAELNRARLERLEAQLQPHFLFNTLNAISSLMYRDPEAADRMLGRLRICCASPCPHSGPRGAFAQRARMAGLVPRADAAPFRRSAHHPAAEIQAETLNLAVPRLILQPLVENALRHGAAKRAGPAEVTISACRSRPAPALVVDDGPGLSDPAGQDRMERLSNTRTAARALRGSRKFLLSNRPEGGLAATVELPVRQFGESNGR